VIPVEQLTDREIRSEQEQVVTSKVGTFLPARRTELAESKKTRGSWRRARGKLLNFLESTVDEVELEDSSGSEGIDASSEGITAVVNGDGNRNGGNHSGGDHSGWEEEKWKMICWHPIFRMKE
jgi:hypothetical protein